jgi:CarboxypepD_reg-like domain
MLTDYQSREYRRFQTLGLFFTEQVAVIDTYEPFKEEVQEFDANFSLLEEAIPEKEVSGSKGITADKGGLKKEIAVALSGVCSLTKAYALKTDNGDLATEMSNSTTKIGRLKDEDVLGFAKAIQSILNPLYSDTIFAKYQVTDAVMKAIVDKAVVFNNKIGKADVEDSENSVANTEINRIIKLLQGNIVQFDLLIDFFILTNAGFVEGYEKNSAVNNSGTRHSGLAGEITDAVTKEPIKEATIKLLNTDKSTKSDLKGEYILIKMHPGDYEVEISAGGYKTKAMVISIKRGRILDLDVELEKIG